MLLLQGPHISGRELLSATCLAPGLMHVFLVFATSWPVQSGSRSFLRGSRWVRPALRKDLCMFPRVCYSPACAKRVALLFWGRWSMSATCLAPGHIACFPCVFYSPACAKRVALFFVAGCDLPCARRVALFFLGGSCKCDLPSARRVALFLWVARLPTLLDPFWSSWAEI